MSLTDLASTLGTPLLPFDPEVVYRRHVKGRRSVYLDSNVWIDLADGKTAEARADLDACRSARASGAVVFPLSYAAVSELLEQEDGPCRRRQAQLMDELSDGVALRFRDELLRVETQAVLPMLFGDSPREVGRERAFTYVLGYLGGEFERVAATFAVVLGPGSKAKSLEQIMDTLPLDRLRSEHRASKQGHLDRGGATLVREHAEGERGRDGKLKRSVILLREQHYVFGRNVWPALEELACAAVLAEPDRVKDLRMDALPAEGVCPAWLARVFQAMPSCNLYCEVMAARVMNTRQKEGATDLLDNEHARVAPAYSDAFVTRDGGLRQLLRSCRVPAERGCRILATTELRSYLESPTT